MMKKTLKVVALLSVAVLLTACGAQSKSSKSSHNSTQQTTQTKKSAAKGEKATRDETTQAVSDTNKSANQPTEPTTTAPSSSAGATTPSTPASSVKIDSVAIYNQDYSSIAGTWVNDAGAKITITADGTITDKDGATHSLRSVGITPNSSVYGNIHNGYDSAKGDYATIAGYTVYPAGVKDADGNVVTSVDLFEIATVQGAPVDTYHRQ